MNSTIVESKNYYPGNWNVQQELREYLESRHNYLITKRVVDVTVSLLVMILVFPLIFPIVMLLIRLTSRGPVFFKQRRVGYMGRTFWCLKFRTMYVNDSSDTRRASRNDPRVTPLGAFLRNTCLDELPQFVNVLRGDMSMVGPRPHMLRDSKEFSEAIANYKFRSLARPGITGISQVRGYRGPAANFESIFRRYQWDAYYVRNMSLRLDIKIMVETAGLMLASVFNKSKPMPIDSPVYGHGGMAAKAAKKIA